MSYYLKLSPTLYKLYLVFNIVKLTAVFKDLISGRCSKFSLDPTIIDRGEEWEVEKILDSY